jgi:two-component system, chemotaxis family, chemotaxis protein CheY
LNILLAEDELITRKVMDKFLSNLVERSITLEIAKDGTQAIDLYNDSIEKGNYFDLIILDIVMPYVNGREVLKYIRKFEKANPEIKKTIIFIATSLDRYTQVIGAFENECDLYLVKPLSEEKLIKAIGQFFPL